MSAISRVRAPARLPRTVDVPGLDDAIAQAAAAVAAACGEYQPGRAQVRAGLGALLGFLDEHPDLTWSWLTDDTLADHRRKVDAVLADALPRTDLRTISDGWSMVHARLWGAEPPRLTDLVMPLMALIALREDGLDAVAAEV